MLRALILSWLVVSVLAAREIEVNTPDDVDIKEVLDEQIRKILEQYMGPELTVLKDHISLECATNDIQQNTVQQSATQPPFVFTYLEPEFKNLIGDFERKLNIDIDLKLNAMSTNIISAVEKALEAVVTKQDVVEITQTITELATSSDMTDVKDSLTHLQNTANTIATLATKDDVTELQRGVEERLNEMAIALDNVTSCTYNDEFNAVIDSITRTEGDIKKLENTLGTSITSLENSCVNDVQESCATDDLQAFLQGTNASLQQNYQDIERILNSVAEVHNVKAKLQTLEGVVRNIYDNTLPPAPTTTPAPTTPAPTTTPTPPPIPLTPCEDSRFIGDSRSFSVCQTAVRFKKCTIELMSFHCCATCTAAGMLPLTGPHRYLDLPRTVSILEASRALVLAKKAG